MCGVGKVEQGRGRGRGGEAGLPPNANQSSLTGNTLRGKNTASFRVHLYLAGNSRFIVAGARATNLGLKSFSSAKPIKSKVSE